ncbi:MAG: hypothetical protein LBG06_00525 [Deltaproteobacteria bacterium]|jgi:hypothetical protein|nr:hypothetical protein [Deltaproteobacteria bacterium]
MEAISRKMLRQSVTLFSPYQREGRRAAVRTLLRHVRFGTARVNEAVTVQGRRRTFVWRLLVDRRSTIGLDPEGGRKPYVPPEEWALLAPGAKEAVWTMNTGDWAYALPGNMSASCPPWDPETEREQEFRQRHALKTVAEIVPVIDEDGTIHHWKVLLD